MQKKILLIDDDQDLLRSIQVTLESQGFSVKTAKDGDSGYTMMTNDPPDLLVLDVMMKTNLEGYYLLHKIKKNKLFISLPIILLTGMADEMGVNLASGVDDDGLFPNVHFQDKPIDPMQLAQMIEDLLVQ